MSLEDNDYCIIFEKGVRPIKAKKYYYFLNPEVKKLAEFTLNHNDSRDIDRGTWRKYNPYNPYVPEKKNGGVQDLKVESLDDLFVEEDTKNTQEPKTENPKEDVAPVLPQDILQESSENINETENQEEIDLQKELEAKFDELFGPVEDK